MAIRGGEWDHDLARGADFLSGAFASVTCFWKPSVVGGAAGWLTDRTRTESGCLFYEAVEVGHLLVQRAERHVFALQSFGSQSLVVLQVLAESMYAELRNLARSVSYD